MLNVATPFTALTVSVPPTSAGVELIVTCAEDPVSKFPFASSTCTVTELSAVPAVPVDGADVNANIFAGPAAMETEVLVTLGRPDAVAVNV